MYVDVKKMYIVKNSEKIYTVYCCKAVAIFLSLFCCIKSWSVVLCVCVCPYYYDYYLLFFYYIN